MATRHTSQMRSTTLCAHRWMQRSRGHTNRSFTKGAEALVPPRWKMREEEQSTATSRRAENERRGGIQPVDGVLSNGQHIANSCGPNY
jgi:hypothetical protein